MNRAFAFTVLIAASLAVVVARQPSSTHKVDPELQEKLSTTTEALPVFVLLTAQSELDESSWRREPTLKKRMAGAVGSTAVVPERSEAN